MYITVFTPTYNRAYCLPRLYESLFKQTDLNFEWLIVDDGSTDNTQDVVQDFIKEKKIRIKYIFQKNRGKHIAINRALSVANGEMFYIVDSDDALPEDAVEFINHEGCKIQHDDSFAGLAGCDMRFDGVRVSNILTQPINSNCLDIRYKYGVLGDLAEVVKTKVLKHYPFPEIIGERFCPEALVWNRIALDGLQLRYYSKVLKLVEYLPDGLTVSIVKARAKSPIASTMYYAELTKMPISLFPKIKAAINYWRFWFCKPTMRKPSINILWWMVAPAGLLMYCKDRIR